jgi:TetR/AcrR family transcriptional repressor of nem operon
MGDVIKKTKGEITRERILDAARELFNAKGFSATTINDLVEYTGAKKGCLYFHFSGKDEIAQAVFQDASAQFMGFLDKVLEGENAGAALDNFLNLALERHISAGFVGGCIFGNTALEMSDSNEEFARLVEHFFDEWIERLACVARRAQLSGQMRRDIPAEAVARQIVAILEGGIMMSRLKKSEQPMHECLDVLRRTLELKSR